MHPTNRQLLLGAFSCFLYNNDGGQPLINRQSVNHRLFPGFHHCNLSNNRAAWDKWQRDVLCPYTSDVLVE